mgnify:CR=1 FL=1
MQLKDAKLFRQLAYIDGKWVEAESRKTVAVNTPADDSTLGTVPDIGASEARRAIAAADEALPDWRARTLSARACSQAGSCWPASP